VNYLQLVSPLREVGGKHNELSCIMAQPVALSHHQNQLILLARDINLPYIQEYDAMLPWMAKCAFRIYLPRAIMKTKRAH
jgi:hypothetical protein